MISHYSSILIVIYISLCVHVTATLLSSSSNNQENYYDFTEGIIFAIEDANEQQVSCLFQNVPYEIIEFPSVPVVVGNGNLKDTVAISTASSEIGTTSSFAVTVSQSSTVEISKTTSTVQAPLPTTTTTNNEPGWLFGWNFRDQTEGESSGMQSPDMELDVLSVVPETDSLWKVTFRIKSVSDSKKLTAMYGSWGIVVDLGFSNNGYATSLRLYGLDAEYAYADPFDMQATIFVTPSLHGSYFCLPDDFGFTYQTVTPLTSQSDDIHSVFQYFVNPGILETHAEAGVAGNQADFGGLDYTKRRGVSNFCWKIPYCFLAKSTTSSLSLATETSESVSMAETIVEISAESAVNLVTTSIMEPSVETPFSLESGIASESETLEQYGSESLELSAEAPSVSLPTESTTESSSEPSSEPSSEVATTEVAFKPTTEAALESTTATASESTFEPLSEAQTEILYELTSDFSTESGTNHSTHSNAGSSYTSDTEEESSLVSLTEQLFQSYSESVFESQETSDNVWVSESSVESLFETLIETYVLGSNLSTSIAAVAITESFSLETSASEISLTESELVVEFSLVPSQLAGNTLETTTASAYTTSETVSSNSEASVEFTLEFSSTLSSPELLQESIHIISETESTDEVLYPLEETASLSNFESSMESIAVGLHSLSGSSTTESNTVLTTSLENSTSYSIINLGETSDVTYVPTDSTTVISNLSEVYESTSNFNLSAPSAEATLGESVETTSSESVEAFLSETNETTSSKAVETSSSESAEVSSSERIDESSPIHTYTNPVKSTTYTTVAAITPFIETIEISNLSTNIESSTTLYANSKNDSTDIASGSQTTSLSIETSSVASSYSTYLNSSTINFVVETSHFSSEKNSYSSVTLEQQSFVTTDSSSVVPLATNTEEDVSLGSSNSLESLTSATKNTIATYVSSSPATTVSYTTSQESSMLLLSTISSSSVARSLVSNVMVAETSAGIKKSYATAVTETSLSFIEEPSISQSTDEPTSSATVDSWSTDNLTHSSASTNQELAVANETDDVTTSNTEFSETDLTNTSTISLSTIIRDETIPTSTSSGTTMTIQIVSTLISSTEQTQSTDKSSQSGESIESSQTAEYELVYDATETISMPSPSSLSSALSMSSSSSSTSSTSSTSSLSLSSSSLSSFPPAAVAQTFNTSMISSTSTSASYTDPLPPVLNQYVDGSNHLVPSVVALLLMVI